MFKPQITMSLSAFSADELTAALRLRRLADASGVYAGNHAFLTVGAQPNGIETVLYSWPVHVAGLDVAKAKAEEACKEARKPFYASAYVVEVNAPQSPDEYLARFPEDHRASADRGYTDGYNDGLTDRENGHALDKQELATVLAALRFWQRAGDDGGPEADILTNGGEHEAMSQEEIDALCERINH